MKQRVYVVTMYRWGNRENHSYVLGVYSTKTKAKKAAEKERVFRGGTKYYPECIEIEVNADMPCPYTMYKVIVPLERNPDFS